MTVFFFFCIIIPEKSKELFSLSTYHEWSLKTEPLLILNLWHERDFPSIFKKHNIFFSFFYKSPFFPCKACCSGSLGKVIPWTLYNNWTKSRSSIPKIFFSHKKGHSKFLAVYKLSKLFVSTLFSVAKTTFTSLPRMENKFTKMRNFHILKKERRKEEAFCFLNRSIYPTFITTAQNPF